MPMTFTYRLLPSLRWEVLRGDMVMAVFGSEGQASDYCNRKNADASK